MSVLAEQLRMLGRQAGATPARIAQTEQDRPTGKRSGVAIVRGALPDDLRRMLGIRSRLQAATRIVDRELPGLELAPGLLLVERSYDFGEIPARFNGSFAGAGFEAIERAELLHFDTETTGLSGGTGTRAFMIGAADWINQKLRVRQLYLTAMAGEQAMLEIFAGWLLPETVLVSYNGRCYDSPLLATRYRLARIANPLSGLRHLDLLFPVRRRFRGIWENCRLATIERQWLGVIREDDLPGSEAPRAWRDYLRGESAADLRRVIAHNDQDLRSLSALLLRLGETDADGALSPHRRS
ncbi:MAG: ribonuclease H-like domain-containing protein [Arenimonas sp.]